MSGMEQFIEQKVCQEIDCLTVLLVSVFDENQEKLASYGKDSERIVYNALFNFIVNVYQPKTKSPLTNLNYQRYAEQARENFNKVVKLLTEFKPRKFYR